MVESGPNHAEELGHESLEVSARAVSIAVGVLFAGVLASLLLVAGLISLLADIQGGKPAVDDPGTTVALPPGVPNIDANQVGTLRELRAREDALLTEYAWIDREAGVARVPIHRAMEILGRQPPGANQRTDE